MSVVDADEFIKTRCKNALAWHESEGIRLYRGIPSQVDAFIQFPPKGRKSANTSNYSTLIIDNDPAWAAFPKRSESFICTTDEKYAYDYGTVYEVYPADGANIGVCPGEDIWFSFSTLNHLESIGLRHSMIATFNEMLQHIFFYMYNQKNRNDTSYDNIVKACKAVDAYLEKIDYDYTKLKDTEFGRLERAVVADLTLNRTPILQRIQEYLSPTKNHFKHMNINSAEPIRGDHEVWTDSPCVFKKLK